MIVTLDGRRLECDFPPGCTLATLVDEVRAGQLRDRLVVSVVVNGRTLGESDFERGLATVLGSNDQVDLESGDRHALVADALRGVATELEAAGRVQMAIAEQLSSGQAAEAIPQIGESIQAWQTCRSALLQSSGLLGRDLTRELIGGRSVEAHSAELAAKLRELRDALEARDLVLLADLLHYDLPPLCQQWHELLSSLADRVGRFAAAPE